MKRIIFLVPLLLLIAQMSYGGRAKIDSITGDPYISALVLDADSGTVLFEDQPEAVIYPASVLKMMVLLVILERTEQKMLNLDEMVQVTKEAAQMGGSQVYLDPKERFSVEELLYALMIQSANDAAVALAMHVAGSKQGFVDLMNKRAAELGMKNTRFHSVHGLPPAEGQKPDKTTAVDLAILSRELAGKPETFKYTGTREREFRGGTFIMRTHNHLLESVDGCDGFKTGYFKAAGFSIVATAKRGGVRIISIVLGSRDRKVRDAKASELLAKGFAMVPPKPGAETAASKTETVAVSPSSIDLPSDSGIGTLPPDTQKQETVTQKKPTSLFTGGGLIMFGLGFAVGCIVCVVLNLYRSSSSQGRRRRRLY